MKKEETPKMQWTNMPHNFTAIMVFSKYNEGYSRIRSASALVWKDQDVNMCLEVETPEGMALLRLGEWVEKHPNGDLKIITSIPVKDQNPEGLTQTNKVVREASRIVSKDVTAPKAVREGLVKEIDTKTAKEWLSNILSPDEYKVLLEHGWDWELDTPQLCKLLEQYAANQAPPSNQENWVSVKDELPEDFDCGYSEPILVFIEPSIIRKGLYDICKQKFRTLDDESLQHSNIKDVTHWMPLPEPPRDQKGD